MVDAAKPSLSKIRPMDSIEQKLWDAIVLVLVGTTSAFSAAHLADDIIRHRRCGPKA